MQPCDMYNLHKAGEVDCQRRLAEYLDRMEDDTTIVLQNPLKAPHFTPPTYEEYFITERPRWVEDCNNERRYRFQAYRHGEGGMFIGYTFVEAFNIYPIVECACNYVLLPREVWEQLNLRPCTW